MKSLISLTFLYTAAINASDKKVSDMSADADGWIFIGAVVVLILAGAALVFGCAHRTSSKRKNL